MFEISTPPGVAWIEVVSRPTLQAFSRAFSARPILEAAVAATSMVGADDIYAFFRATRTMYDHIAFVQETRSGARACLEWEGAFHGKDVSGATILAFDGEGLIERIRLFHYPYEQLIAFATEFSRRRALNTNPIKTLPGAHHEIVR